MVKSNEALHSQLAVVAALSATASSLITYGVVRWYGSRSLHQSLVHRTSAESLNNEGQRGALFSWIMRSIWQGNIYDLWNKTEGNDKAETFQGNYMEQMNGQDSLENDSGVPLDTMVMSSMSRRSDPFDPSPRQGYLSWDDYFMAVAFLSAQRSKDPAKQVGACIVDSNNVICGIGYNGFPRGCPDSRLPWSKRSKSSDPLQTKYPYVCHAEMNAILNKNGASVAGARVYVTMFPCNECAKLLIQAGISEIIFHEDKAQPRAGTPAPSGGFKLDQQYAASRKLLHLAGVKVKQHQFDRPVHLTLSNNSIKPYRRRNRDLNESFEERLHKSMDKSSELLDPVARSLGEVMMSSGAEDGNNGAKDLKN